MSRFEAGDAREGEPSWWPELRERILKISVDLEEEYERVLGLADAQNADHRARLKRLKEELNAPDVIIENEEKMRRRPFERLQVIQNTLTDFSRFCERREGNVEHVLPFLWKNHKEVYGDDPKYVTVFMHDAVWFAISDDRELREKLRAIGELYPDELMTMEGYTDPDDEPYHEPAVNLGAVKMFEQIKNDVSRGRFDELPTLP